MRQGAWNVVRVAVIAWGCAGAARAQGEPDIVWSVSPKGPLELKDEFGIKAAAVACDAAGRTYVLGAAACPKETEGWFLAARDAAGSELWRTEIPAACSPCAELHLDAEGDCILGGSGWDGNRSVVVLAKVGDDGAARWSILHDAGANADLWLQDLAVAPSGSIAALSSCREHGAPVAGARITAFDPQGNLAWEASYDAGTEYVNEIPVAVTTDAAGNVFIASASSIAPQEYEYAIVKYDPSGARLWGARYRREGYRMALPVAIAAAPDGGAIVTGTHIGDDGGAMVTVRCDAAGGVRWASVVDGADASALAVDGAGLPCAVGIESEDIVKIVKYAENGDVLWMRDVPMRLWNRGDVRACMDAQDNLVIALNSRREDWDIDVDTMVYDAAGNERWRDSHDEGSGYNEYVSGLAVSPDGRVAVSCLSMISTAPLVGHALLRYDAGGGIEWHVSARDNTAVEEAPGALAAGAGGIIYFARASTGLTTREDFVTAAHAADGRLVWERRLATPGHAAEKPRGIGSDTAGNVYVTGVIDEDDESARLLAAKYTPAGDLAWFVEHDDPALRYERHCAAAVSPQGDAYIAGYGFGPPGDSDTAIVFTIKYDAEGRRAWRADVPFQGTYATDAKLALAPAGGVHVTAMGGAAHTVYTVRYLADGTKSWSYEHSCPVGPYPDGFLAPDALLVDGAGNAYVIGRLYYDGNESITTCDVFIEAIDPEGRFLWEKVYSGPGVYLDVLSAAALGADGSLYVAIAAAEADDAWACRTLALDAGDGALRWDRTYRHEAFPVTVPRGMTADAEGNVAVLALAEMRVADWNGATPVLLGYDRDGGHDYARTVDEFGPVDDFRTQILALHPSGDLLLALRTTSSGPCFDWPRATLVRLGEAPPGGRFIRGDTSGDGAVNIADAICALGYLFGPPDAACKNITCADAFDANDDEVVNIGDPIFLLGYLFAGGAAPPAPGPLSCGRDITGTELDCGSHAACGAP